MEYDLELHKELSLNYELITKLVIVCLRKKLKLIIENPYSEQHYLRRYWCIKPQIIDYDRRNWGDKFKKPTQYWFINVEPKNELRFEANFEKTDEKHLISFTRDTVERSMITSNYASRFIREYII